MSRVEESLFRKIDLRRLRLEDTYESFGESVRMIPLPSSSLTRGNNASGCEISGLLRSKGRLPEARRDGIDSE